METFKSFEPDFYAANEESFGKIALDVFQTQVKDNPVYKEYTQHLGIEPGRVTEVWQIPFLPISFFKNQIIKTGDWTEEKIFTSSGTTASAPGRHYVRNNEFYLRNSARCFRHFFGELDQYHFLALLPSYLERGGSSLIEMISHFIQQSKSAHSGFYLHNLDELVAKLLSLKAEKGKAVLWGVSFALLDLAEKFEIDLSRCIIMETGGMKGRRAEITREELHEFLKKRFNASKICSEYGMTELFSQAYSQGNSVFECPPWMKIILRDPEDPLGTAGDRSSGGLNVIDLANVHTCSFIETQDLGKMVQTGRFEVLGRFDNADIRGCNLLLDEQT